MKCELCSKKIFSNNLCQYHYNKEYYKKHKLRLDNLTKNWRNRNKEKVKKMNGSY